MCSSTQVRSPVCSRGCSGGSRPCSSLSRTPRLLLLCPDPRPGDQSSAENIPRRRCAQPRATGSSCSPTGNRRIRVRSTAAVAPCSVSTGEAHRMWSAVCSLTSTAPACTLGRRYRLVTPSRATEPEERRRRLQGQASGKRHEALACMTSCWPRRSRGRGHACMQGHGRDGTAARDNGSDGQCLPRSPPCLTLCRVVRRKTTVLLLITPAVSLGRIAAEGNRRAIVAGARGPVSVPLTWWGRCCLWGFLCVTRSGKTAIKTTSLCSKGAAMRLPASEVARLYKLYPAVLLYTKHQLGLARHVTTIAQLLSMPEGVGNRAFSRWLTRVYRPLFPRLPEHTRLFRLFMTHHAWTEAFLATPTVLGVIDTYINGLQSKQAETATTAFSGPHSLHLSPW